MRSGSACVAVVACLAAGALLVGCTTTQDRNARAQIAADRVLAIRHPVRVAAPNPDVRVLRTAIVRRRNRAAVVVVARNAGVERLSDLPVAIVLHTSRGVIHLNGRRGTDYFQTHVPSIPPGRDVTWVFTTRRHVPAGRLEGRIRRQAGADTNRGGSLPKVTVRLTAAHGRLVTGEVSNDSDVPQTGLSVSASARRGGRYVGAGRLRIVSLAPGATAHFVVPLVGSAARATVTLDAPPTMLR